MFGGAKDFCLNFPKLARKNFVRIFSYESRFWDDLWKKAFVRFWAPFFSNQSTLGAIFPRIFRESTQIFKDFAKAFTDFAQISTDFSQIFRDFSRIFTKSKFLGVSLHSRLLHHWFSGHVSINAARYDSIVIAVSTVTANVFWKLIFSL